MGLVYLNPQRITYLKVHMLYDEPPSRAVLQCRLDENGLPETMHEVDVARSLPLQRDIRLRLYKLISVEAPHVPFSVGLELVVEAMDVHIHMACNDIVYWKGQFVELSEELERRMKKAREAAARRQAAQAKAAAAAGPKAAAKPRAKHRAQQRPANQGLSALMDIQPGESAGDRDGQGQVEVRLLAEGEMAESDIEEATFGAAPAVEAFPGGEVMRHDWREASRSSRGNALVSLSQLQP